MATARTASERSSWHCHDMLIAIARAVITNGSLLSSNAARRARRSTSARSRPDTTVPTATSSWPDQRWNRTWQAAVSSMNPAIGRAPRLANVYCGYGHQHVGLTLATATGRLIARQMEGEEMPEALKACDPGRFG